MPSQPRAFVYLGLLEKSGEATREQNMSDHGYYSILAILGTLTFLGTNTNFKLRFYLNDLKFGIQSDLS